MVADRSHRTGEMDTLLLRINFEVQQPGTSCNAIKKDPVNQTYHSHRGRSPRRHLLSIHP